jgi:hypothetical protein
MIRLNAMPLHGQASVCRSVLGARAAGENPHDVSLCDSTRLFEKQAGKQVWHGPGKSHQAKLQALGSLEYGERAGRGGAATHRKGGENIQSHGRALGFSCTAESTDGKTRYHRLRRIICRGGTAWYLSCIGKRVIRRFVRGRDRCRPCAGLCIRGAYGRLEPSVYHLSSMHRMCSRLSVILCTTLTRQLDGKSGSKLEVSLADNKATRD